MWTLNYVSQLQKCFFVFDLLMLVDKISSDRDCWDNANSRENKSATETVAFKQKIWKDRWNHNLNKSIGIVRVKLA